MNELGYPNLAPVYFGFVAPAGTPRPIIQKLHDEITRIGNEPEFRKKRLIDIGIVPIFDTPEHFGAYIKSERAKSERLVKDSGFQPR